MRTLGLISRTPNGADFHGYCDLTNEITRLALMPAGKSLIATTTCRVGVGCGLDSRQSLPVASATASMPFMMPLL